MGFYAPHTILWDAYRHDVDVQRVDVNRSVWDCTVEGERILRLGFRMVDGLGAVSAAVLPEARGSGFYQSIADFIRRSCATLDVGPT